MPVYNVFFLTSGKDVMLLSTYILDCILKFSGKKAHKKTCAWNYQQSGSAGSAEIMRIGPFFSVGPETRRKRGQKFI